MIKFIGVLIGLCILISFSGIEVVDTGYRGVKTRFGEVVILPHRPSQYGVMVATRDLKSLALQRISSSLITDTSLSTGSSEVELAAHNG